MVRHPGRLAQVTLAVLAALAPAAARGQQNPDGQIPLVALGDPLIMLLRDDEVLRDIEATPTQRAELAKLADAIDLHILPARNQSSDKVQSIWQAETKKARARAAEVLDAAQLKRVEHTILWIQGAKALLRPDVAETVEIDGKQSAKIKSIITAAESAVAALHDRAAAGEPVKPLEDEQRRVRSDEQRDLLAALTNEQKTRWAKLAGPPIDAMRLGRVSFAAPQLVAGADDWINPPPVGISLKGRVTAVHFFAHGCSNCRNNYPHYLGWQKDLVPRGLRIVGIHTPETAAEEDVEILRQRVAEAGFEFHVLVDNQKKNWQAWGNSIWPAVYLVDRQGRIRAWWYGELAWQGADGEQRMRKRIEELLAEDAAGATAKAVAGR